MAASADIQICPQCRMRVLPDSEGLCPSCRGYDFDARAPRKEASAAVGQPTPPAPQALAVIVLLILSTTIYLQGSKAAAVSLAATVVSGLAIRDCRRRLDNFGLRWMIAAAITASVALLAWIVVTYTQTLIEAAASARFKDTASFGSTAVGLVVGLISIADIAANRQFKRSLADQLLRAWNYLDDLTRVDYLAVLSRPKVRRLFFALGASGWVLAILWPRAEEALGGVSPWALAALAVVVASAVYITAPDRNDLGVMDDQQIDYSLTTRYFASLSAHAVLVLPFALLLVLLLGVAAILPVLAFPAMLFGYVIGNAAYHSLGAC